MPTYLCVNSFIVLNSASIVVTVSRMYRIKA
jgi:hypothetical protein